MNKEKRLKLIQQYVANVAIGPTTLRGQGPKGTTDKARKFLARIRLRKLTKKRAAEYRGWLKQQTRELMKRFTGTARKNWGAARKSINIFMKEAYFNKVLEPEYKLYRLKDVLEVPLDNPNADEIKKNAKDRLCQFRNIKRLDQKTSDCYQNEASNLALKRGLPRGELDILLWPEGRNKQRRKKKRSRKRRRTRKKNSRLFRRGKPRPTRVM